MAIIISIVVIILLYMLFTYNLFISKKNKVKQAYSGIDVYLTQRFELIPNLIECVKGYMTYEKETLEKVTEMRKEYLKNKNLKDGEILDNECNRILAIAENYPELKASEQFLNLQKNLSKMESQLQAARRIYNMEVTAYNNCILMFPNNILANILNFREETLFKAEEQVQNNIQVNIEKE